LAGYGKPRFLPEFRAAIRVDGGTFETDAVMWDAFARRRCREGEEFTQEHADLAASVRTRLEEVLLELAAWLAAKTGLRDIAMAGRVALNCVANGRLAAEGPFDRVWVQPAAGDAGASLGAALYVANELGDRIQPMTTAALSREWSDDALAERLNLSAIPFERRRRVVSRPQRVRAMRPGAIAVY